MCGQSVFPSIIQYFAKSIKNSVSLRVRYSTFQSSTIVKVIILFNSQFVTSSPAVADGFAFTRNNAVRAQPFALQTSRYILEGSCRHFVEVSANMISWSKVAPQTTTSSRNYAWVVSPSSCWLTRQTERYGRTHRANL